MSSEFEFVRRGIAAVVSLAVVSLALVDCAAGEDGDITAANLVNAYRATVALPSLWPDAELNADARRWAGHLADTDSLSHDALKFTDGWTVLGENVGRGASIEVIQRAFEDSPTHEENLVGDYTHLGVAVASRGDTVWIVQRFGTRIPIPTTTAPPVTLAPVTTTVTIAPPVLCRQVIR